jgi:hypothetical protein
MLLLCLDYVAPMGVSMACTKNKTFARSKEAISDPPFNKGQSTMTFFSLRALCGAFMV